MTRDDDFYKIKQALVEEIRGMRSDLNGYLGEMKVIRKTVDIHDQVLYGDKLKDPGMTEDVRNLKRMATMVMTSVTGTLGLFGEFIFRTFFHHSRGG